MPISFKVNGRSVTLAVQPTTPLLDVLRDDLGLTGTKQGCDYEGECGACTVLLDGRPVRSCLTLVGKVAGRQVRTVEGLAGPDGLNPLQQAFIDVGAVQCGYCTPGMLMAAQGLLDAHPKPSQSQILEALEGNLCRCTGYRSIILAVERAATLRRGEDPGAADPAFVPVGGDHRRADAVDKVTGCALYVEDMVLPAMTHACVLRSPHPHARLVALDPEPALRLPGVIHILTAADIPGENGLGSYSSNEPVLTPVGDTVKMVGAPVGLVVAETADQALVALNAIEVEYQTLPHTFDLDEALSAERSGDQMPPIYGSGNILTRHEVRHGDVQSALNGSDLVLETTYHTAYLEHSALEREVTLGYIDDEGRVTVTGATHEPHWNQGYIASTLALDPAQVRFVTPPIGGSFGGKQDPWPSVAAGLAAFHVRRPVRLAYTRAESFDASPKRHPYRVAYQIGARLDGRLTGIRVRIDANTGGYDAHGQYLPNYAVTGSGGPYRWQAVDAYSQTVYTNGPKSGQFRGFGSSQSTFALECALDELADALNIDPLEFRRQNALDDVSPSFLGYPVGESMGFAQVLEAIQLHYRAAMERAADSNAAAHSAGDLVRHGAGLAGMWYRFGKSGSLRIEAQAELMPDGRVTLYCSAPDYGQGTTTMLSQFGAEELGLPRSQIDIVNADTALTPDSGIQGASRSTYFVGGAVRQAAHNLRVAIVSAACELLDCPPDQVTLAWDRVLAAGSPGRSISLKRVAEEFDRIGLPRRLSGFFDLSPHFPAETRPEYVPLFCTGAQLAEVAVDLRTGVVEVKRMVAAQDVGRAINPVDAQGQLEGAILMGLGAALMEEVIPGASTGFANYYLPTIKSMPEMDVLLVEVPGRHGPLGVKGLGEAAMPASTPAITNAISQAIGARIREIPATPERVLCAIQSRHGAGPT